MSSQLDISYSTVEAFERSKRRDGKETSSHLFMAVLLAVFFIVLMGGLIVGVSMYRYAAQTQMETDDLRIGTGLLTSYVKANDRADVLAVGNGPEGPALVLTTRLESGDYEVRIYQYQGQVVQEYSVAGSSYTPERAQKLIESDTFEFQISKRMVTITTDQGETAVVLRSSHGESS